VKFSEIFPCNKLAEISKKTTIGIDIGSRQAKAVLLSNESVFTALIPTGFFIKQTANELLDKLFEQSGLSMKDVDYIVSTGYGRVALSFDDVANRVVSEISCHGMGAHHLGNGIRTIIDIGGQDSKAIKISPETGKVTDFIMNDKCAAGTGRFLEKAANILDMEVTEIGMVSLHSKSPSDISSQCVVFAESEIISKRARGESTSDLAAGIHLSVSRRINHLLNRVGIEPNVLFTGGVSNNVGMKKALEDILGFPVETPKLNAVFAGALGAALYAGIYAQEEANAALRKDREFGLDLTDLDNEVEHRKEIYIRKITGHKKNVAYLCSYTPIELINAADVAHIRMVHAGNPKEVSSAEVITQSVFCDFTKGCLGALIEGNPLYAGIDKVYTFYTCDCMRKTAEAMNNSLIPTTIFNLPRMMFSDDARHYLAKEISGFKKELEELTGESVSEEEIRKNIKLYNTAKGHLRKISGFRKEDSSLIKSSEFQRIAMSYYYVPAEILSGHLEKIIRQLTDESQKRKAEKRREMDRRPIRLMISGGIIAEGDTKLTKLIEDTGARIVVEDNCTGYSPFAKDIEEKYTDVFEDLAAGYLNEAPCARMKPISAKVDFTAHLAQEYKVDGVVFQYMKFCPCFGIVKREFIHRFQKLNIPVLEIASDYSTGDEGQLKTRIEAFVEVLKERSR